MNENDKIGTLISATFRKYGYSTLISQIILFGSRANGTAKPDSDFDILVVLNCTTLDWKLRKNLNSAIYEVELEMEICIDIHYITEVELKYSKRGMQAFFQNALKYGVVA